MTEEKNESKKDRMIYVAGSKQSWRCPGPEGGSCGCNVFRRPLPVTAPNLYKCNACGTRWRGE